MTNKEKNDFIHLSHTEKCFFFNGIFSESLPEWVKILFIKSKKTILIKEL